MNLFIELGIDSIGVCVCVYIKSARIKAENISLSMNDYVSIFIFM